MNGRTCSEDSLVPTNYNRIAERYQRAKLQPWRSLIESFTLLGLIGDLKGKSVVDLACGEGHYTRILRKRGASKVVGVDVSEGMIELARAQELANPLGVQYRVQDARTLTLPEEFDLAVAAYLLTYARDRDELLAMCQGIARCLKLGGRFVGICANPALDFREVSSFRKYGFNVSKLDQLNGMTVVGWDFNLADGPLRIENYHLAPSCYEDAFFASGLRLLRWRSPQLAPEAETELDGGHAYWAAFLAHPPVIFLEGVKSRLSGTS
jgi:ubiquinone/menaquinone biosynthesis C-methylase UbiE